MRERKPGKWELIVPVGKTRDRDAEVPQPLGAWYAAG